MKRYINPFFNKDFENVFGMCNLIPKDTDIRAKIWSEHNGISNTESHSNTPRVKIGINNSWISITIEPDPEILASSSNIRHDEMKAIKEGIEYVGRNYDLFLKHYTDINDEFSDLDLMKELNKLGEFKM